MAAALAIAAIFLAVCTTIVGVIAYRTFKQARELEAKERKARRKRK